MARPTNAVSRLSALKRGVAARRIALTPDGGNHAIDFAMEMAHPADRKTFLYTFEGASAPPALTVSDTSAAGSPTLGTVSAHGGEFQMATDATSEEQNLALYGGDVLSIDPTKNVYFECRFKVNFAGAAFSADQRLVVGLAAARNASLDANTDHVWFRIEGASRVFLLEGDDSSTNTDDQASSPSTSIVDDTYVTVAIDLSDTSAVKFYIDQVFVGTVAIAAIASTDLLQPYIEMQRTAGTEVEDLRISYILISSDA